MTGWDYRKKLTEGVIFTHAVTVHPAFEDIEDYRVVMDNAFEFPFAANEDWKLQLGVRSDYDAIPEPGIDRLDSYYYLNIALDWK